MTGGEGGTGGGGGAKQASMGDALAGAVSGAKAKLGGKQSSWLAGLFSDKGSWVDGNSAVDGS